MESQIKRVEKEENKKVIKLGYVQWASAQASSYIIAQVLEKAGFDVELYVLQTGIMYQSTAKSDIDAFVCSWLPDTDRNYWKKYKDDLLQLNDNYLEAQIGLVVPKYVDIDSLEELKANEDKFNKEIIGIDPGAAQMIITKEEVMPKYNISNWELKGSSGPAMTSELKKAIKKKKWIVVTGWKPHWKWAKWDLKFLKDPKKTMGDGEFIKTMGRKNIKKDLPKASKILEKYQIGTKDLSSVMLQIQNGKDPKEAAKEFIDKNPELLKEWIKN